MTKKILVVDDRPDDLESMQEILESNGYRVAAIMNQREALQKLDCTIFDLILLDVLMPELSGYEVLRKMRRKVKSETPFLFVSIIPKAEINTKGVDGFIQKPFRRKSFLAEVEACLAT